MAELTVVDVIFALKQLQINADSKLLRRIEWTLGKGNHEYSEERLRDELSDFVLRRSRSWRPFLAEMSLDDFLCDEGISLQSYHQFYRSLNSYSSQPPLLNTVALDSLDENSSIVTFAQNHPAQDVILKALRELDLSHIQCKAILGLGAKSYKQLKRRIKQQRKEELSRRGRSEDDAWSFAKHIMNELCLRAFKISNGSLNLVLETHQGIGDATFIYQRYGHVLGFENHIEAHQVVLERARASGLFRSARDLYLRRITSADLSSSDTAGPWIFITEEATPCERGLRFLINQGLHFDAIDVDPWTTSKPHFSDVLKVLADPGLVMLTIGDQHPWPKGENQAWERFGVESYNVILSEEIRRSWRQDWAFLRLAVAWYMRAAVNSSICLLPILVMRNFEPWAPRDEFPHSVMGVDRVYFLGKRVYNIDQLEHVFQSWTEPLPYFGKPALRTEVSAYALPSSSLNFLSFTEEIWPAIRSFWPKYHRWLLETAEDLASRWRRSESLNISETRECLRQAIEQTCLEKVTAGYELADSWLRTL